MWLPNSLMSVITPFNKLFADRYVYKDLKDLENQILEEVRGEKLKIVKYMGMNPLCEEYYTRVIGRDIVIRIDVATSMPGGGSFSFIYVDGMDLSTKSEKEFDYSRVIRAINDGRDPGAADPKVLRSLYHV